MDLSIIIPMYNGKLYMKNNIDTLCAVNCNKEIIIIDDGSTDDSYDYCCKEFKNNHDVRIYKKKNGGISDARNFGLRKATGKYLLFVDQDDRVDSEVVSKAYIKCCAHDLDGVFWSCNYESDGITSECDIIKNNRIIGKQEINNNLIEALIFRTSCTWMSFVGHIWAGIYRKKIVDKGIEFKHFVDYEDDQLFVLDFLTKANSLGLTTDVGYYWNVNPHSYSRNYRQLPDIINSYKNYFEYIKNQTEGILSSNIFKDFSVFSYQFTLCEAIRNSGISKKYRYECIKQLKETLTLSNYKEAVRMPHPHISETRFKLYLTLLKAGMVDVCILGTRLFFIIKQTKRRIKGNV